MDLDAVLMHAASAGASDIHLKVGQPPVLRRNGVLERLNHPPLDDNDVLGVLAQVTAGTPHRRADFERTGELDVAYAPPGLARFRVSGFRQRGSTGFAFRLISEVVPDFESLRLPRGILRLAEERQGLIFVTGTTGSGKTTTLAALVDHINRTRHDHILTIEDPIEVLHKDINCLVTQRDVGDDTASFQVALRRALRQDPDVLVIGELRDDAVAQTALSAAESGHLVLTTMHTLDASETVKRMVDFFPASKQPLVRNILAGVLKGVVSQRLMPCLTGGRVIAVELMVANARIAESIREDRPHEIQEAIREGEFFEMQTFNQALVKLVLAGQVDAEYAANAAPNRHDFLLILKEARLTQQAAVAGANGYAEMPAEQVNGVRGPLSR